MKNLLKSVFTISLIFTAVGTMAQSLPVGFPVLEESLRRAQLLGELDSTVSFTLRPLNPRQLTTYSDTYQVGNLVSNDTLAQSKFQYRFWKERGRVQLLPFHQAIEFNTHHPYPQVNGPMVVNRGFQSYSSVGVYAEVGPLSIQFQPEHIWAQNRPYEIGQSKTVFTEYLERWGDTSYSSLLLGQSSVRLNAGAFSLGVSNENIWWGPGQFNSLMFTNNAFGFQHLTLNTRKPAKTFLGSFEGQLLLGRLEGTTFESPITHSLLMDDWRYLNAILISYQPKWIPGFTIGGTRVFQQYDSFRGDSFADYFPVINPFQKVEAGFDMDLDGRDQKASVFLRYAIPKAGTEVYFEYGRRDHAYDWREFLSNPEHARAYLMGFSKLFKLDNQDLIQVRGEMLQQQESINILARYMGTGGGINWAGHTRARNGMTHYGQMIGPGIGPSSNVQTIETSWISGNKKLGVRLDRLNRHQDIFVKQHNDATQNQRWVDLNLGLLADWQFGRLFVSSQWFFINSLNYQWRLDPNSTAEFPKGMDVFNFQSTIRAAYVF